MSTKQEGMEQPIEEHEQAARSFMASHAQIVWSVSTDTTVEDAPLCRVFIGQGEEEMRGQSWLEAVHPDDRERMMYTWRNTLVTLKACETSCRLRRPDGSYGTFAVRAVPLFEQDGRVREWVGVSTDITAHQRLEDELRASEERFRLTFEQAAVGIAHVGFDGRWLLVNPKLCNIVGYAQEELLAQTLHAVLMPDDLSTAFTDAQRLITGEQQTYARELRFRRKDGVLVWVNLTVTLVRNQAGWPLYFLAIAEDVTARKQAEQQRQLNQLKDQFILHMNHELRTPLTSLLGSLDLLRMQQGRLDAASQAQFLETAISSCGELLQLVNSVLDALTITEQMIPPQGEEIAVASLVRDVLEHLDPGEEQVDRLSLDIPDRLTVWANEQLLRQVLRNLLSNAFKYCPKPAPVVVSAVQIDQDEREAHFAPSVCIGVQDAGPGIPPEELPLLFQQFTRLKRDLSGQAGGSGLGLYISKRFVEAMGGRIWVESPGINRQGSRFCVLLPGRPSSPGTTGA
ncbi:MAG: PAS domain S-box protein [Chloroflexi bacterium]|nr:MAG: PAS domain S-box protein [Chloroflexota bacterium]